LRADWRPLLTPRSREREGEREKMYQEEAWQGRGKRRKEKRKEKEKVIENRKQIGNRLFIFKNYDS
jgi:hypothetical protein